MVYITIPIITHGLLIEPSKPLELTVERDTVTKTEVTLSWKRPNPPDPSIIKYEVHYRKSGEDVLMKKESSTCDCKVTGLTAATKYEFRVAAINLVGCGPFTDFITYSTSKCSIERFCV